MQKEKGKSLNGRWRLTCDETNTCNGPTMAKNPIYSISYPGHTLPDELAESLHIDAEARVHANKSGVKARNNMNNGKNLPC